VRTQGVNNIYEGCVSSVSAGAALKYYSFGSVMPNRKNGSALGYRYGFNGQEKDDEISGNNNSYTAAFWEYDPRLGRRWNMDPVVRDWESSYACFSNNPINMNDPDGLEPKGKGGGWPPKGNKHGGRKAGKVGKNFHVGKGKKDHQSIGQRYMKAAGWARKTFTGAKHLTMQRSAGRYETRKLSLGEGDLNPGEKSPAFDFRKIIDSDGPGMEKLTQVNISVSNADAKFNTGTGKWEDAYKINGYVYAQGQRQGLDELMRWRGIHANSGISGWKGTENPFGNVDASSEALPGLAVIDQILDSPLVPFLPEDVADFVSQYGVFIKAAAIINKQFIHPNYKYTTSLRVVNSQITEHKIHYEISIRYRTWQKVKYDERGFIWKLLHKVGNKL